MYHIYTGQENTTISKLKLPLGKVLKVNNKTLDLTKPNIMGYLNINPDLLVNKKSNYFLEQALKTITNGATVIDIGVKPVKAESESFSAQQELDEISKVLEVLVKQPESKQALISIYTSKPEVMERIITDYNIDMINDARALRERDNLRDSLNIVAKANIPVILMHMQNKPRNLQRDPRYEHVLEDVYNFFIHRIDVCQKYGIKRKNILLDPGFGFGKTWFDNASLLKYLAKFQNLNCPIVAGINPMDITASSSKINLSKEASQSASLAFAIMAIERGASLIRCHGEDIAITKQAVDLAFDVLEDGNCVDE